MNPSDFAAVKANAKWDKDQKKASLFQKAILVQQFELGEYVRNSYAATLMVKRRDCIGHLDLHDGGFAEGLMELPIVMV